MALINIKKFAKPKETTNVSQAGYANSTTRIINQTATGGVAAAFEPHYLWGQYFDDTRDITGDMTDVGSITASGTISTTGNITAGGTITGDKVIANDIKTATLEADAITADDATITSILSQYIHNTGDIVNDNMITTKDLTVTGTAHFFELIIDKIKASGGAAIFTPADGFRIEDDTCIIPVQDGYVITFYTTDGQRAIRNMWQVGDQAICRSFNEAHVGTSYNVKNKYYWTLVTQAGTLAAGDTITNRDGDVIQFEEDRHFIRISTQSGVDSDGRAYYDGTVDPEVGDEIAMLGYRGTDDPNRQSAIYISAYSSMDPDIHAPFIAHYKGINDFQLSSHRKTWFAANSSQITGALKIQTSDGDVDVQTAIDNTVNNSRQYIHTAYCRTEDNSDNSFSRTYFADAVYMGTAYTNSEDESSLTFEDYAPWVRIRGVDGRNGTDGAGITTVEEWYYANSSTRQPEFNESTWTQGTIPSNYNTTNRYLWNVEIIVYSTGERAEPTTPQMLGVYGTDGRGIQSITEYYKKSPNISGVTNTDTGWQTTVPTVDETNRYLWNYELIRFTDNTTQRTPAVLIGMYAEDGRSVEQIVEWYYVTTSDTPKPTFSTSTWTKNNIPAMDETNAYLWNVEEINYNDTTEYTGVALIGHFGADGRGIQSVTEYYAVHTSMDTAPTSGWQTSVPTMNATYKYLWNYERITYTDGNSQDTEPALIGVYSVGEDGKYTQFVYKYAEERPDTPTGQTIPPSGWMTTITGSTSDSQSQYTLLTVTRTAGSYTQTISGKWQSPSTAASDKSISTFQFTLAEPTKIVVRLEASSENGYDYGVAGKLDNTTSLGTINASTVKQNLSNTSYFMEAVSGTDTADVEYNCSAGTHKIQIGYFKDSSGDKNDDCVYATFYTETTSSLQLWMSFAVVDKGIVSPWSYPVPMGGRDGRDGTDGRDGVDGTDGRDAIAYYLSQSSGTFTYSGSSFSPANVTLYLVRSDGETPIVDTIIKSGCNVTNNMGTILVTPTSTTSGGYFEITCLNDDGSEWGTLRYSYNLITKSFVSEIVEDQMTNYATKTEVNSLGQTVQSNSSWIQQNSEKVASAVTAQDLSGYITESELTQTANTIKTEITEELSDQFDSTFETIINLTSLYTTRWYPVSITLKTDTGERQHIIVDRMLDTNIYGSKPNYGSHSAGFVCVADWSTIWSGWGVVWSMDTSDTENGGSAYTDWCKNECNGYDTDTYRFIHNYDVKWTQSYSGIPGNYILGSIRNNSMTNHEIIYLRGGSKYRVRTEWEGTEVTIHSNGYYWERIDSGTTYSRTAPVITSYSKLILPEIDQMKRSEIVQTVDSITMRVNDVSTRLDSGGFTINANTTINGQLNINNESEQGFIVSGDNGNTSILSKSIGSYNYFKNRSSEPILVGSYKIATFTSSGGSYTSDTINFGTIASNRTLTFKTFSASAKRPNSGTIHHTTSWSATVNIRRNGSKVTSFNVYNTTTSQQTYTTQMEAEYSISITWNIQATDSSGNSLVGQAVESSFGMYAIIPNAAYTLIGYDGIASNFSNNRTIYFGAEGTYIRYTDDNVLRVTTDGIQKYAGTSSQYYKSEWAPINGCGVRRITTAGSYPLLKNDDFIVCAVNGTVKVYLGSPASNVGRRVYIKKIQGSMYVYGYSNGGTVLSNIIPHDGGYTDVTSEREQNWNTREYISDGIYWIELYMG